MHDGGVELLDLDGVVPILVESAVHGEQRRTAPVQADGRALLRHEHGIGIGGQCDVRRKERPEVARDACAELRSTRRVVLFGPWELLCCRECTKIAVEAKTLERV